MVETTKIAIIGCLMFLLLILFGVGGYFIYTSTKTSDTPSTTSPTTTASTTGSTAESVTACNKVPVYRKYAGILGHMDTIDKDEGGSSWSVDFGEPLFHACSNKATGTIPVFRGNNKHHITSTSLDELTSNGFTPDFSGKPIFYAYAESVANTAPVYRLRNEKIKGGDHLTSMSATEGTGNGGYILDGKMFYAFPA